MKRCMFFLLLLVVVHIGVRASGDDEDVLVEDVEEAMVTRGQEDEEDPATNYSKQSKTKPPRSKREDARQQKGSKDQGTTSEPYPTSGSELVNLLLGQTLTILNDLRHVLGVHEASSTSTHSGIQWLTSTILHDSNTKDMRLVDQNVLREFEARFRPHDDAVVRQSKMGVILPREVHERAQTIRALMRQQKSKHHDILHAFLRVAGNAAPSSSKTHLASDKVEKEMRQHRNLVRTARQVLKQDTFASMSAMQDMLQHLNRTRSEWWIGLATSEWVASIGSALGYYAVWVFLRLFCKPLRGKANLHYIVVFAITLRTLVVILNTCLAFPPRLDASNGSPIVRLFIVSGLLLTLLMSLGNMEPSVVRFILKLLSKGKRMWKTPTKANTTRNRG